MLMLPMAILMIEDESDRVFIERLYMEHRFLMFKKAFEIVRSPFAAEDIVSEVSTLMVEKIACKEQGDRSYAEVENREKVYGGQRMGTGQCCK